jgi:uncharacterized membrane protein YciS (DUF1049 family)
MDVSTGVFTVAAVYWIIIVLTYVIMGAFYMNVRRAQRNIEEQLQFLRSQLPAPSPIRVEVRRETSVASA